MVMQAKKKSWLLYTCPRFRVRERERERDCCVGALLPIVKQCAGSVRGCQHWHGVHAGPCVWREKGSRYLPRPTGRGISRNRASRAWTTVTGRTSLRYPSSQQCRHTDTNAPDTTRMPVEREWGCPTEHPGPEEPLNRLLLGKGPEEGREGGLGGHGLRLGARLAAAATAAAAPSGRARGHVFYWKT